MRAVFNWLFGKRIDALERHINSLENELLSVKAIAQEAHLCAVQAIPNSGIVATKINGEIVTNLKK